MPIRGVGCDDGRAAAVAIFQDFEEVVPRLFVERFEAPIIQDQDLNMAQCALQPGISAVATSEHICCANSLWTRGLYQPKTANTL